MPKVPLWYKALGAFVLLLAVTVLYPAPVPFTDAPYSTVLFARSGDIIGARVAADDQWRYPPSGEIPGKYRTALLTFEDKRFYNHPGIDPWAMGRAMVQNIQAGRIVSGGSTISMQTMRLAHGNKPRTIVQKCIEAVGALRLEARLSKADILRLYVSHVPFGGNVVGYRAASRRYFARDAAELTWAEASLLAVLPNTPGTVNLQKNSQVLKEKRDRLLTALCAAGHFPADDLWLYVDEPVPEGPRLTNQIACHLVTRSINEGHGGELVHTGLDAGLQQQVLAEVEKHRKVLAGARVHNAAVIVVRVATGEVAAYVGNTEGRSHGSYVDMITSPRSTGSVLKPFLYAFAMEDAHITPFTLLPDYPVVYKHFAPQNYTKEYDGAIKANHALAMSLNIPFVHLLEEYNYNKFHERLARLGIGFEYPARRYGLSLIIGGSEATLEDITAAYAGMARALKFYTRRPSRNPYSPDDYRPNTYLRLQDEQDPDGRVRPQGLLSAGTIWAAFEAMQDVQRPEAEMGWELYTSSRKIAWKTGTSYNNKDAWAVGVTPEHVTGVWVGNADGEGRPEIKGSSAAGPLLFDVMARLDGGGWFPYPGSDMKDAEVCLDSGMLASAHCARTRKVALPARCLETGGCTYCKTVHLDKEETRQVDSSHYPVADMVHRKWFVLPPVMEWYYKRRNPSYRILPPKPGSKQSVMQFIYPKPGSVVYIPRELDGTPGEVVFEAAHGNPDILIYWHLDGRYLGKTRGIHQIALRPARGIHMLTALDENGNYIEERVNIASE